MKTLLTACVSILTALLAGLSPALADDIGVVTGSEKGTYYQFGLDLQKLAKQSGINLAVYPSKGSVENLYAVYQRPGVQMGIVQSDVLAFVARVQNDATLRRVARKTRMVFPLYNEEVHVLGRTGITDFDDLAGRRVAIGRDGSGTYLTARILFKLAEVTPREMVPIDTTEALAELKAGRIDAMFYVAGYPVRLLKDDVSPADGLILVPVTNKSALEFYPSAEIPANTYSFQPEMVPTAAVKSVLVSFDYRRKDCDSIGRFAQIVSTKMDWLQKNGHAKWKAVDLDYPLRGWEQYDCVRRYLGKANVQPAARRPGPGGNPIMDAIKEALGE
ncbi:MAG: TAXI family TRAP transporter solute-binding subunit [Candidatus Rokuibacteriota bacterium]